MVYLLHFDSPLKHAKHYIGFVENAQNLEARMNIHLRGNGSKLIAAVVANGITFRIARLWHNASRTFERQLKNRKEAPKLCPICNPNAEKLANL